MSTASTDGPCERRRARRSLGAAVQVPWNDEMGAPGVPAAMDRRKAGRQQCSESGVPAVQQRIRGSAAQAR
ncbi:hypothetical protein MRX96_041486 [Rhipicephalus microplus]